MSKLGPFNLQSSAVATGNGNAINVGYMSTVTVVITGLTGATITFEGSISIQQNAQAPSTGWVAINAINLNTLLVGTTAASSGAYLIPVSGLSHFRARVSSYTSGTINANANAQDTPYNDLLTGRGTTMFNNIDVDESEDAIKATAGQLYELYLYNSTTAPLYVKLYNDTVANVIVGTTVPDLTIPVPGNNDSDGAGVVRNWPAGLVFSTAITIACTTGVADNDSGAPSANALIASGAYK